MTCSRSSIAVDPEIRAATVPSLLTNTQNGNPPDPYAVWMELLETDLGAVDVFLDAARTLAKQPGGRRESGILLWMLAEATKEKGVVITRSGPPSPFR